MGNYFRLNFAGSNLKLTNYYIHPLELSCCTYTGDDILPAMCNLQLERVGD